MAEKIDKREEAYIDWKNGMKYKDIASKHGISESAVKSWASRYWKNKEVATEKVATNNKKLQLKSEKVATERGIEISVVKAMADAVDENTELNEKQKEFCVRFMQNRNATMAYMKAYNCSYGVANTNGPRLLVNARIQEELKRLREIKNAALGYLCGDDVVELHMRIAFADITDFVEFKGGRVPIVGKDGEIAKVRVPGTDGEPDREITRSYVENTVIIKDSDKVDGALISEIYTDKGEAHIKLADKTRSLKFLEDYFELNPHDRHKRDYDIAKMQLEKDKLKMSANKGDDEPAKENNLLEAIINSTKEDIDTDDIPELQQETESDSDMVEQTEI